MGRADVRTAIRRLTSWKRRASGYADGHDDMAGDRTSRLSPYLYGNWQWVAGTGTDTKPYRGLSPARQAERYDPDGLYVRRYLTPLSSAATG